MSKPKTKLDPKALLEDFRRIKKNVKELIHDFDEETKPWFFFEELEYDIHHGRFEDIERYLLDKIVLTDQHVEKQRLADFRRIKEQIKELIDDFDEDTLPWMFFEELEYDMYHGIFDDIERYLSEEAGLK